MIAEIDNQTIKMEIPNDPDEIRKAIGLLETLRKDAIPTTGGIGYSERIERYFEERKRKMYQHLVNPDER